MRRLSTYFLTALTTFLIGSALFFAVQIYNVGFGPRQMYVVVEVESPSRKEGLSPREKLYFEICEEKLYAEKKNANASNITDCMNELERMIKPR
jgi:hypothetical protein